MECFYSVFPWIQTLIYIFIFLLVAHCWKLSFIIHIVLWIKVNDKTQKKAKAKQKYLHMIYDWPAIFPVDHILGCVYTRGISRSSTHQHTCSNLIEQWGYMCRVLYSEGMIDWWLSWVMPYGATNPQKEKKSQILQISLSKTNRKLWKNHIGQFVYKIIPPTYRNMIWKKVAANKYSWQMVCHTHQEMYIVVTTLNHIDDITSCCDNH